MMILALFFAAFSIIALAIHLASLAVAARRMFRAPGTDASSRSGLPVTIVRPVSQADPYLRRTLESTFALSWRRVEIIFCAAHESDPAVPFVRELLARHPRSNARLLIGNASISQNPKLNNCVKGWHAAAHDLVVLVDSNVLLPRDYVQQMLRCWDEGCGLVSAPPVGSAPANFWASVECAFLNSHQARWQLVADELGMGFAQGKNLMFRKSILDPLGGIAALAAEPAEDAAATRVLRQAGYHVRLARLPFAQPLGSRNFGQLWSRQLRWAKLRHATFPQHYLLEMMAGGTFPALAAAAASWSAGVGTLTGLVPFIALWLGGELVFGRATRWHESRWMPLAIVIRDLLLPVIWLGGFMGKSFEWQGHRMSSKRGEFPSPNA